MLPDLSPDEGIDRDELAVMLDCNVADASAVLLAECGEGLTVLHRLDEDGHDSWRLGDVEAIAERRRRDPRTPATARSKTKPRRRLHKREPMPPEVRSRGEILFSDTGSGSSQSRGAMTIGEAAKQAGMTDQAMTDALVGKARLQVVKGELVVSVADVNRLAKAGKLPKPSKVRETQTAADEAEGKLSASRDPAVEARAKAQAEAIGVDVGPAKTDAPRAGVTTAKASDRGSLRLGAPQRWSAAH